MAELNFGLLTPPGSQSIGNAFVQGMDQAAVARAQENQNALSQYTLSKARREDEVNNRLLSDLRAAKTPEEQMQAYVYAGRAKDALAMQSDILKNTETRNKILAQPGAAARVAAQTARDRQQWEGQAIRDLGNNPSDDHIRALGQDAVRKEIYTQDQADQKVAEFLAVPLADRAAKFKQYGAAAPQQNQDPLAATIALRNKYPPGSPEYIALDAKVMQFENQNYGTNPVTGLREDRRGGAPAPAPRGVVDSGIPQGVTPLMQAPSVDAARQQALAMNAAGLPVNIRGGGNALPGAQPQPQPPDVNALRAQPAAAASALNPKQQSDDFQTQRRLEEAGYRRTPQGQEFIPGGKADPTVQAKQSTEKLSAKDLQKRETDYPQARQAVKTVNNTMTLIGATVDRLLANPDGLNGISGLIYGRTVALTAAARAANADLGQLKNLAFVQGLTELRAASKSGAGVGNVSNREGDRFENLKASLDTTQSTSDLTSALTRLKDQAAFTSQTLQETFDDTYAYKTPADSTVPPTTSIDMPTAAAAELARRAAAKR